MEWSSYIQRRQSAGTSGLTAISVPQTFYNQPTGTYTVSGITGGPTANPRIPSAQILGSSLSTGSNTWNLTFTVAFSIGAPATPTAATSAATNIVGDGATLNGVVNSSGVAAGVWFEWGTDSSFSAPNSTTQQTLPASAAAAAVEATLTGLESNITYYYRIAVNNGGSTVLGSILPFTTLSILPAPALFSPTNGSVDALAPPLFSWSAVPNATSYRLVAATTPGALPTDPTSPTCSTGCVLDVTPPGSSYVPPAVAFSPLTTYYWEVHSRSPSQFGTWSAISEFTTGPASVNAFSRGQPIIADRHRGDQRELSGYDGHNQRSAATINALDLKPSGWCDWSILLQFAHVGRRFRADGHDLLLDAIGDTHDHGDGHRHFDNAEYGPLPSRELGFW